MFSIHLSSLFIFICRRNFFDRYKFTSVINITTVLWNLSIKIDSLKLHIREYSHFKKDILANSCMLLILVVLPFFWIRSNIYQIKKNLFYGIDNLKCTHWTIDYILNSTDIIFCDIWLFCNKYRKIFWVCWCSN